jgi:hypothetical protein
VALEVVRSDFALDVAADAIDDRANVVMTDRCSDLDDRMACGVALHRAAAMLDQS